MWKNFVQAGKP